MGKIKLIRKALHMSQEAFGKRLGVTGTAISRIEKGERSLTEQMILAICREYHVNYFWLTKGTGDMFTGTPETVIDELVEEYDLDDIDRKILVKYLALAADKRAVIKEYFKEIFT